MIVAVHVAQLVGLCDPFSDLGFRPLAGGYERWPPTPTLDSCRAVPPVTAWLPISRRGHAYDLGRLHHFLESPSFEPIRLLWRPGELALCDGRHRLGAAWLAERETIPALLIPWPVGVSWCE
jgi:hypothetical protein